MFFSIAFSALGQAAAPAAPIDDWQVANIDDGSSCLAVRHYVVEDKPVELEVRRSTTSDDGFTIAVAFERDAAKSSRIEGSGPPTTIIPGDPTLTFLPSGIRVATLAQFRPQNAYAYRLEPKTYDELIRGSAVSVDPRTGNAFELAVTDVESAITRLGECRSKQWAAWGLHEADIAVLPHELIAGWFRKLRFPPAAKKARAEGRAIILATADGSGRIVGCRILATTRYADLDEASCKAVAENGSLSAEIPQRSVVAAIRWAWPD